MREHVDLVILAALEDEWADNPPVHQLVAAYLDYKRPAEREAEQDSSLLALMSAMPVHTAAPKLDDSAWREFAKEPAAPAPVPPGEAPHV